jgi:hypothetical protein
MNVTKTKCLIAMLKISKNEIFGNFGPFIEHGPHLINYTILIFISEQINYSQCLYKIWNKTISFNMKKNKIIYRS